MSSGFKNVLLIGGTAITTAIVIDVLTDGAVRNMIREKSARMRSGAATIGAAVANGATTVADGVTTAAETVVG